MSSTKVACGLVMVLAGAGSAAAVEIGHHTVRYLGTSFDGGTATARWAVTENGCDSSTTSALGGPIDINSRRAGGGTNCNSMSHIAFADFLCDPADLLSPDAPGTELFWTQIDVPACIGGTLACRETVYQPGYGASRPDGPGDWIKFSTHNTEPKTVQLAKGFTHVFAVAFRDSGQYLYDDPSGAPVKDPRKVTNAAIKVGKVVVIGVVQAPACAHP
jgi:hypothetical protein